MKTKIEPQHLAVPAVDIVRGAMWAMVPPIHLARGQLQMIM